METVNEKTCHSIVVGFYNEDGSVTPSSGTYEIDDVDSGTVLKVATALPSLGETVTIPVASAENAILNPDAPYEVRRMTVKCIYGDNKPLNGETYWAVLNLKRVT